jgi:hypothetical protein
MLLQRYRRVTYRTLQIQLQLDDEYLAALKEQLLYAHPEVRDDAGRGLIWTGPVLTPGRTLHPEQLVGVRLSAIVPAVIGLLQREGRVSYWSLAETFGFDQALMECIKQELLFKRVAYDEQGNGLVWIGTALATTPSVDAPGPGVAPDDSNRACVDSVPQAEPVALEFMTQQPLASPPDAERRQLTVLFCDLVGSTQLSGQLDPEDLRALVRAYQEAAAEVIQSYEGHIAQYLGDGLLVYFGYPTAHEDDARRAVHTGLGIVHAIATLNTRLAAQYGVHLAVRLGIHTGPVVVGVMGFCVKLTRVGYGSGSFMYHRDIPSM